MEGESVEVESLIDVDETPAPGADEQKPKVETPAPAAEEQKAETETPEQQQAKRESRRQRARLRDAQRIGAAEAEARLLREQLAKQQRPTPESSEPKREQFEDYESYLRAVAKHDAQQEAAKALESDRKAREGKEQSRDAVAEQRELAKRWNEREKAFKATAKDYDDVVGPYADGDLQELHGDARLYIVESDLGPQLLKHLADSDEHDRIKELSPRQQVAALARLEDSLKKPAPKASNAPPPIKPVQQGRSAPNGFSENMSDSEYREWRKGHGARWAQR